MGWDSKSDSRPTLPPLHGEGGLDSPPTPGEGLGVGGSHASLPSWGGQGRVAARVGKSAATTKRGRKLRKTLTPQEARLWLPLRPMRAEGVHFRRQAPFRGFYLDFVCFRHRLVIEVDGCQHADEIQADHDVVRDAILKREGFRTLRFWNSEHPAGIATDHDNARHAFFCTAPDTPTCAASRRCPPHEGREGESEGGS